MHILGGGKQRDFPNHGVWYCLKGPVVIERKGNEWRRSFEEERTVQNIQRVEKQAW
jgi:hypothetical protein